MKRLDRQTNRKENEGEDDKKVSSPPYPMATEWEEGHGRPLGPVNQQFTAETYSRTPLLTLSAASFSVWTLNHFLSSWVQCDNNVTQQQSF